MPARILVTSGITAGHRHWIDQSVMRVGSDSGCAIVIPSLELAGHAATLEYRSGQYFVHNKSRATQQVDRRPLEPAHSSPWSPGQAWSLAADVVLVLEVEGDPAPSMEPNQQPVGETEHDPVTTAAGAATGAAPAAASSGKSASSALQIGVIALCVVGGILLLVRDRLPEPSAKRNLPSFSELVEANRESMPEETRLLQYARSLKVRDRPEESREWLRKLRDRLLARQEQLRARNEDDSLPMLDYTLEQLGK